MAKAYYERMLNVLYMSLAYPFWRIRLEEVFFKIENILF
jgi:hypothetical protein